MDKKQLFGRIAAVSGAVALTILGAWYASERAEKNVLQTASTPSEQGVIILDAGHGGST